VPLPLLSDQATGMTASEQAFIPAMRFEASMVEY
jgi:hypothetical protein